MDRPQATTTDKLRCRRLLRYRAGVLATLLLILMLCILLASIFALAQTQTPTPIVGAGMAEVGRASPGRSSDD